MKVKIVLGIVALLGIGVGTYIYQNRYSFYRYLPAENENKLQSINYVMRMEIYLVEELKVEVIYI